MRIAIKFDDSGRMESYCSDLSVTTKDEILPSSDGFEFYETDLPITDIHFFVLRNGKVELDEDAKRSAVAADDARRRYLGLKSELAKIKEDIEQERFGLVRDDYAEKKARAAEIINELRVLEGKQPREVQSA